MKYKMVACDCDNTLIDSNGYLPEDNLRAIRKIMDMGAEFVIASGRNDLLFADYAKEIGGDITLIGCNGATVRNLNKNITYRCEFIPKADLSEILDYIKEKNLAFKTYTLDAAFTKGPDIGEKIKALTGSYYENKIDFPYQKIKTWDELKTLDILKVVLIYEKETLLKIRRDLEHIEDVNAVFSSRICLDIISEKASKGDALKYFAAQKGILPEEIIAFGDTENDLSMLRASGLSVCMKNGEDSLKALCKMTTERDNSQAGVAHTLNKIFNLNMY